MSCETGCLEISARCCESVVLRLSLNPTDLLKAVIKKPGSKHIFEREVTVDNTGAITLDKSDFPAGFLSCGYLEVNLRTGAPDFLTDKKFIVDSKEYSCVLLELIDIDD